MSLKAFRRAAFSAAAQAPYIAMASVAAPAGIPNPDARSFTHDIRRKPLRRDHNTMLMISEESGQVEQASSGEHRYTRRGIGLDAT